MIITSPADLEIQKPKQLIYATNIVMKMKVGEKMKARNSWPFLVVWLLCFALLAGCALKSDPNVDLQKVSDAESDDMKEEDSELAVLRKNILDSESNIGVAFIGYVDSESTEADLYTYLAASETGQKYPCLSEAPLVMMEGQELYAIVPPNEEWTVTVYPSMITDDGTYEDILNAPIYTGDPGEVLLVRCNLSEIYSNVLIVSTDGVAAISFRPSLSMEDGHLVAIAGVYDFSVYEEGGSIIESDDEMLENPGLKALREEILQNGTFGAAFIGYVGYDSTGADLYDYLEYSATGQTYPFLSDATLCMAEGQELYVIVPQAGEQVKIYSSTINENGEYVDDVSDPLLEGGPGEIVLLRCNVSEIYSDVRVVIVDGFGAHEFRPFISGRDGKIVECVGLYDFSVYEPYDPGEYGFEEEMDYLCTFDEVKEAMKRGMRVLYTGQTIDIDGNTCKLFSVGTDHEEQFVDEFHYAVCGDLVYSYDVVNDIWTPLGMG